MIAEVDVALLFGVANALHCAAMCGPFAVASSGGALSITSFLGGKLFAYLFVGAVAGAAGSVLSDAVSSVSEVLSLLTGAAMIVAGLAAWFRAPASGHATWMRRLPNLPGPFALGALTGLLPCGVLALAALRALTLGGPVHGALFMAAFALGTAPALVVAAVTGRGLSERLGPVTRRRLMAGMLLGAGVLTVMRAGAVHSTGGCPACSL